MLIEFRVANFRSLKDEQALTFEAEPTLNTSDHRLRVVSEHRRPLLPVAIICGSNASGKSNLLAAIQFMREAVLNSDGHWRETSRIPRTAFKWAGRATMPSLFEVNFLLGKKQFQYGFCLDDERVLEEWLYEQIQGDTISIFERERQTIDIHPDFKPEIKAFWQQTSTNCLFFSSLKKATSSRVLELVDWFRRILVVHQDSTSYSLWQELGFSWAGQDIQPISSPENNEPVRGDLITLQQGADLSRSTIWRRSLDFLRTLDLGILDIQSVKQISEDGKNVGRILIRHADDPDAWLELREESKGTQCLLLLAPYIMQALETGGLLLIDELDSNLHPLIGLSVVRLFNEPDTNPHNAQVLFTTHDTRLLGNTLGDCVLRKDQIWFAEKEKDGASIIFPLTDFHSTDGENFERGYLQGRYGAIPHCETFSWDEV